LSSFAVVLVLNW